MVSRYLDLDNINHLIPQSRGGGAYDDKLWRESYYFNMTDPGNNITMITTIGLLPNRNRSTGFLLIIKDKKPVFLKPLASFKKPTYTGPAFSIGNMCYRVQGTDWILEYQEKYVSVNLRFTPINKIYPYRKDPDEKWAFERIATQHYEQFGIYRGFIDLNGNRYEIGSAYGHRDHSWGIRDWSSMDRYSLHCCAFSDNLAFNLWEGSIRGAPFFKGFVFDGEENIDIVDHKIQTEFRSNGREPIVSHIEFRDSKDRKFRVRSASISSVPFPPPGSLVYEGIGKMTLNGSVGYGLQEYLWHYPNKLKRISYFLKLLKIGRGPGR